MREERGLDSLEDLLVRRDHGEREEEEDLGGGHDHGRVGVLHAVLQGVEDVEDLLLGLGRVPEQIKDERRG